MSDLSPDLIEGRRLLAHGYRGRWTDWSFTHGTALLDLAERAEKAEAECKRLREERRWVPCSERMPDHLQEILFIGQVGVFSKILKGAWYKDEQRFWGGNNYWDRSEVTYWQAIPALPGGPTDAH